MIEDNDGWTAEITRRVTSRVTVVSKGKGGFATEAEAQEWGESEVKAFLSKKVLFKIVERVNADENILEISTDSLVALFSEVELDEEGLISLSATLASNMLPDERIKLFKTLSDDNEIATPAYLYTLFDLEMIAPAEDILESSQPEEFIYFKAYKALKDCDKHFNIELFSPYKK